MQVLEQELRSDRELRPIDSIKNANALPLLRGVGFNYTMAFEHHKVPGNRAVVRRQRPAHIPGGNPFFAHR